METEPDPEQPREQLAPRAAPATAARRPSTLFAADFVVDPVVSRAVAGLEVSVEAQLDVLAAAAQLGASRAARSAAKYRLLLLSRRLEDLAAQLAAAHPHDPVSTPPRRPAAAAAAAASPQQEVKESSEFLLSTPTRETDAQSTTTTTTITTPAAVAAAAAPSPTQKKRPKKIPTAFETGEAQRDMKIAQLSMVDVTSSADPRRTTAVAAESHGSHGKRKSRSLVEIASTAELSRLISGRRLVKVANDDIVRDKARQRMQEAMLRWTQDQLRWAWHRWHSAPRIERDRLWYQPLMISSLSTFALAWSFLMLLCIMCVLVIEPLDAAFLDDEVFLTRLNLIFDVLFIYDIFVNFRMGYFASEKQLFVGQHVLSIERKKLEILNLPMCARNYLRSWFLLDFLSSMPPIVTLLLELTSNSAQLSTSVRAIKILKLGRILKITKVLKFSQYLADDSPTKDLVEEFLASSMSMFFGKILSLFMVTLLLAHLLACSMMLSGPGWLKAYRDPSRHNDASKWNWRRQYVAALYWAVTTVSTVGFGDINPHSTHERMYAIVAMVVGVWFYSYIIASVSSIVSSTDAKSAKYYEKMDEISLWMSHHAFSLDLKRRVRAHFKLYYEAKTALDEREILELLNPSLQAEISAKLLPDCVLQHPLFSALPLGALSKLLAITHMENAPAGRTIVRYGAATSSMFFILGGYCDCEAWVVDEDDDDDYVETPWPRRRKSLRGAAPQQLEEEMREHEEEKEKEEEDGQPLVASLRSPPGSEDFSPVTVAGRPRRAKLILGPDSSFGEYACLGLHPTSLVEVAARTHCSLVRMQQEAFIPAFASLAESLRAMKAAAVVIAPRGFIAR